MFEPFVWMFKAENFKQRVCQLFITMLFLTAISVAFCFLGFFFKMDDIRIAIAIYTLAAITYISSIFVIQGYFWELTSNIISRDTDITANNVYSGKIKVFNIIELPEYTPFKFWWRGIAAIVASFIMVIPYTLIIWFTIFSSAISSGFLSLSVFNHAAMNVFGYIFIISFLLLMAFYFIFMPAMFWNYAKTNSVFAMLDIRKAAYLLENYFGKYLLNSIVFLAFNIVNAFVIYIVKLCFSFGTDISAANLQVVYIIVSNFIVLSIHLYSLHVYAYLLGTITPPTEG